MSYMGKITFDTRESIESEYWKLELIDNEDARPRVCLLLSDLGAIPVTEIALPVGSCPERVDLARAIALHAPRAMWRMTWRDWPRMIGWHLTLLGRKADRPEKNWL